MTFKSFRAVLLFSTTSFLFSACGGGYTTRVIDTPETRHLKGYQRPYAVNGRRYDPLPSHEGFSEQGMASWYGRKFHGKKTSSGEIYDMNAMTAAHKTLPMGTMVKVTNKENGLETVVRINDRGPFVRGRIIDVSYAAAKRLGLVKSGTARVRIEALGDREEADSGQSSYQTSAKQTAGGYAVQIASFARKENAHRLVEEMRLKVGIATIHQVWVDGTPFYRVRAGRYPSIQAAEEAQDRFERQGYPHCFVVAME
jgi:rare lipoprotein A